MKHFFLRYSMINHFAFVTKTNNHYFGTQRRIGRTVGRRTDGLDAQWADIWTDWTHNGRTHGRIGPTMGEHMDGLDAQWADAWTTWADSERTHIAWTHSGRTHGRLGRTVKDTWTAWTYGRFGLIECINPLCVL